MWIFAGVPGGGGVKLLSNDNKCSMPADATLNVNVPVYVHRVSKNCARVFCE